MIMLIVIGGAVMIMVRGYQNFTEIDITTLTLETPKKQSTLDSLRIVAVSDIHLGSVVRNEQLRSIVDNINALKPDIVLIAGDLVDNSIKIIRQQHMEKELRRIKAKYGCYAALGNHDYFDGADKTCKLMLKAGIVPLRDMGININNAFVVAGREDYSRKNRLPLSTILNRNVQCPVIVLDHQPVDVQEAVECGVSLQIMGHTHAGQVFPFNLVVQNMYGDFAYGYQEMGGTHFYTSSGAAGWGAPMRTFSRSEIVLINLKFSNRIK
jgi:predicted MPP superfamily phosphohydrolase